MAIMNQIPEQLKGFLADLDQKKKQAERYVAFLDDVTNACQKHGFKSYRDYEDQLARFTSAKVTVMVDQNQATAKKRRFYVTPELAQTMKELNQKGSTAEQIATATGTNVALVNRWKKEGFVYKKPGPEVEK